MTPKVSVILTTHAEGKYLKQAIGSVLAQTFESWELIIARDGVDRSSWTEDCDYRIHEYCFRTSATCRFASTINQAFKYCTGEYVSYLCHDDLYLPWRLHTMVHSFKKWDAKDVHFGYQQLLDETTDYFANHVGSIRQGNPDQPAGTVDHSSVMHRRECFEKVGGWDENAPPRYGDAYFWMRLQAAGYKFHCIPEVLDVHRFNRESITWKEDHQTTTA